MRWIAILVSLLALVPAARADEAGDLIEARQCFPATLLLSREAAAPEDPAALLRFCGLVTGSCDGADRPMTLPSDPMQAGAAWQSCLRRIGELTERLAVLPPAESCEERADLAAVASMAAARAQDLYRTQESLAARLETVRSWQEALPPVLEGDPCPPPVEEPAASAAAVDATQGSLPERLVAALLLTEEQKDPAPLATVEQAAKLENAPDIAAIAAARRAEWLEANGPADQALAAADAAVLQAAHAGAADAEERALTARARLLDAQGSDPAATAAAYAAAIRALDRRRPELLAFDWIRQGSPYRLRVEPLVERYVALQIDRANALPPDQRVPIYRDILHFAERARAAELSDYFQDDCVAALQARTRTLAEIDPDAAALVTIVQGPSVELFMLLPGGDIRHHRAGLPPRGELEAYPFRLTDPTQPNAWKEQSRQLYDLLIRPFASELSQVATLVFVPDGPLRHVLPATLLDGDTLLLERHAIALNPGLDFIDDRSTRVRGADWLLGAVSRACPPRWDALAGTRSEVMAIEALHPRSDTIVLMDESFARASLYQDLATRPLSVLHFATHAEFAPQASDSKVLLGTCEELGLDDLESLIKQARYRDRPVDLLVLSACQSALGDDRAALGLAGLAVKSGARSALGSMWKVDDAATARLTTLFHEEFARGDVGKAEALRRAQLVVAAEPGTAAPMYWAAFQLVGDWR
ncbi:CHAT domain-containing protein [Geminicoccus roseus]|uniref:CHAT domain-containing protein n=1 Tax=Geminicoccus roseus TaxID=404900 RepID=UPI0004019182|nr:CHAT domain-containing protein [Geminicoccus roseus]